MRRPGQVEVTSQLAALSKVFTPIVMERLLLRNRSGYLDEVLANVGVPDHVEAGGTVSLFLSTLYAQLVAHYRCEYVYKNVIASKILLGRHSLSTAQMLTEVRVGKSKADVVVLNGTSTVYEIKSEYDSMARLPSQLASYSRVFDHVNVVTAPSRVEQVQALLPAHVGVVVLTRRRTLSTVRPSRSNLRDITPDALFDVLRKPEYTKAIGDHFGEVPSVPNGRLHAACKERFLDIPVTEGHRLVMEALSRRFSATTMNRYEAALPSSMRAYACSISSDEGRLENMARLLSMPMSEVVG